MPSVISDDRQYILGSNILALNPIKLSDNVSGLIPYSKRRRLDASTQWSRTLQWFYAMPRRVRSSTSM